MRKSTLIKVQILSFWITHYSLPLGDKAETETLLCSLGGSTILGVGLRAPAASSFQ